VFVSCVFVLPPYAVFPVFGVRVWCSVGDLTTLTLAVF